MCPVFGFARVSVGDMPDCLSPTAVPLPPTSPRVGVMASLTGSKDSQILVSLHAGPTCSLSPVIRPVCLMAGPLMPLSLSGKAAADANAAAWAAYYSQYQQQPQPPMAPAAAAPGTAQTNGQGEAGAETPAPSMPSPSRGDWGLYAADCDVQRAH